MHLQVLRENIVTFKKEHDLTNVIILWTANTERFSLDIAGVNDTYENLMKAVKENHPEVSPSTVFALAALH